MGDTNEMTIEFEGRMCNEGFVRVAVAAFATQLNPTLEEVADIKTAASFVSQLDPTIEELSEIKTAVSEAVTNSIIHGYENKVEKIKIKCKIKGTDFYVSVIDHGKGIENIEKAMEPMFSTCPDERSGMGFSFMEAFMDEISVESQAGKGTVVKMQKEIGKGRELWTTQSL